MDLIMEVDSVHIREGSIGYKWTLRSVKAAFIHGQDSVPVKDSALDIVRPKQTPFLHPMSHALNFMNVDNLFRKNMTKSYFSRDASSHDLDNLVNMIDRSRIKFLQVDSISYQLFQLPGWILVVRDFQRLSNNSGWLISRLIPADEEKKKKYLSSELNIR